jgi:acetolactate decarboxylase
MIMLIAILVICYAYSSPFSTAAPTRPADRSANPRTLYQVSTIQAFGSGRLGGVVSLKRLLEVGTMGLASGDRLDGELTILDSRVYRIRATGSVDTPSLTMKTPFAGITAFVPISESGLAPGTHETDIPRIVNRARGHRSARVAMKIVGTFRTITTRASLRQVPPFKSLAHLTADERRFSFSAISGTIVGFLLTGAGTKSSYPGLHLHFVSSDRSCAGHVLDFELDRGRIELMPLDHVIILKE